MTPREVLIAAKALIDTPEKWTQGWYAKDANGKHISDQSPDATCFCSIGAMWAVAHEIQFVDDALVFLGRATRPAIPTWNDAPERTHAEVMDAFARAIELAADAETVANLNRDLAAVQA